MRHGVLHLLPSSEMIGTQQNAEFGVEASLLAEIASLTVDVVGVQVRA